MRSSYHLSDDELIAIYDRAEKIGHSIFLGQARRGRSLKEIVRCCLIGECIEHSIAQLFKEAGHVVIMNDEDVTGEYWWDIEIDGLKHEIKRVGSTNKWPSWKHQSQIATMMTHLDQLHGLILARIDGNIVKPWCIVRATVLHECILESNFTGLYLDINKAKSMNGVTFV